MDKYLVITLVAAHFLGDWVLQPRWMAINKSKLSIVLFHHLMIVNTILSFVIFYPYHDYPISRVYYWLINIVAHGIIDWYIWRIYAKIRGKNLFYEWDLFGDGKTEPISIKEIDDGHFIVRKDYWFYTTIAIDQFLHLTILFWLFLP